MSIWNCETHGRTGPIACCGGAVRESSTDAAPFATIAVTHPPQDAEAVARDGVWSALEDWQNTTRTTAQVHQDVDAALTAYAAAIATRVRAECGADTARVVQIINSLDNVKPDGDAVSRYELLQAIEEAIRDA